MVRAKRVLVVVERDVKTFLGYKFLLIMRALWFTAQIALFGLIANRMLKPEVAEAIGTSYFNFYAAGISIALLYSTAVFIAYDICEEAEHGVIEYLLSLPISRKELTIGRSIGGGLRSFVLVGPVLMFVLYLLGVTNPLQLLVALTSLFIFSFGVAGLGITITVSMKSRDKSDILLGIFDALIIRLSTAIYPLAYMPDAYQAIARFNPLTFAADLFRWGAGIESLALTPPMVSVLGILLFFSIFTFLGVFLHERRLEGGGWQ